MAAHYYTITGHFSIFPLAVNLFCNVTAHYYTTMGHLNCQAFQNLDFILSVREHPLRKPKHRSWR